MLPLRSFTLTLLLSVRSNALDRAYLFTRLEDLKFGPNVNWPSLVGGRAESSRESVKQNMTSKLLPVDLPAPIYKRFPTNGGRLALSGPP